MLAGSCHCPSPRRRRMVKGSRGLRGDVELPANPGPNRTLSGFLPRSDLELFMARSPVASAPTPAAGRRGDDLAVRLPVLRAALERQRDFRREQLAQVDLHQPAGASPVTNAASDRPREATPALREIEEVVAAGARRALTDIELALARMRTGHYGCCRLCGGGIPIAVLEAIPKTTLCLACQRTAERGVRPAEAAPTEQRRAGQRSTPG